MESPVAANHNAGGFSSDFENHHDVTTPITKKPKTEQKSKVEHVDKEGSSMPSSPKTKYRVGQVIKDQVPQDAKPQAKQPSQDPEPQKDTATKKKRREPQLPVLETHDVKKEKHELEESGIVTGRSGSKTKKSVENASQVSWPVDTGAQGTYEIYEKLMEFNGPAATLQELEAENKMLRQFLKDLNEQLQHHVERAKITNYEGKKTEFKNKSASEQIKTIVKELANNEKILAYNKEEHRKSEARLNVIKDSGYVFGIQKEILNLQAQINAIKKENKQLGLNTGNVGKDLDVIENVKGVPVNLEEAHEREKEAIKLSQKLEILKQKNAGYLEEKKRKLEKEKTLEEKIRKAEKAVFGESYVSPDTLQKYEKLARQAAATEEDFKYAQKTCQFKTTQVSRDLEELYVQHQKEQEHIDKLESVIQEQAIALKELISSEGSRLNRGAQEVLDQIKSSLEQEEKHKSVTLLKNRSLEPVKLNYSSSTKHKNAIKRELEEKKPIWKETNKGERARMEHSFGSPTMKIKINTEQQGEFSKPSRPTKVQKETPVERKKSVAEEPKEQKEQTPKASKKPEVSEHEHKPKKSAHAKPEKQGKQEAEGGSPREQKAKPSKSPEKVDDNISAPLARDEDEKKADRRKKENENKKKVVDDDLDMDDIGQLKEEINHYSHQIQKEVDQKEKSKSPSKKPVKNEVHNEPEKSAFASVDHKDEEHEGQVFDLNNKKEKNQPNMKLDMTKAKKEEPNSSERKSVKEEAPVKEKRHEAETKRKEEKEEVPAKEKKTETETKRKEDDHTSVSVSRTKQETPQKSKSEKKKEDKDDEDEGAREWEDLEDLEAETKKPVKTQVKEVKQVNKPKQNKVENNDDFEEFDFEE